MSLEISPTKSLISVTALAKADTDLKNRENEAKSGVESHCIHCSVHCTVSTMDSAKPFVSATWRWCYYASTSAGEYGRTLIWSKPLDNRGRRRFMEDMSLKL